MRRLQEKIAQLFVKEKIVKISIDPPFVGKSGIKSPIYCYTGILISRFSVRKKIVEGFLKIIQENNLQFDVIAAVATGGVTWGAILAERLEKPFCYIRQKPKGYGGKKQIEGNITKRSKVLVVEDLLSTAGSAVRATEAIRQEYKVNVVGIITIFTYDFSITKNNLRKAKVKWWALTNLLALIREMDLSKQEKRVILDYADSPKKWWNRNFCIK